LFYFEKDKVEQKTVTSYKPFIYAIFAVVLIYSAINLAWYEAVFNVLSLVGVYISLELFNQKFGNTSTVIGSICTAAGKSGCKFMQQNHYSG
jgi:hypothetical protein